MRWEFIVLTAILNLIVALLSGGIAVELYKKRQKSKSEKENSNTALSIARIKDSQYVADKLSEQVIRLEGVERSLWTESLALNRKILDLESDKKGLEILNMEQDEEILLLKAQIEAKDRELASLKLTLANQDR